MGDGRRVCDGMSLLSVRMSQRKRWCVDECREVYWIWRSVTVEFVAVVIVVTSTAVG
jgi:hypothetical protein